MALSPVSSGTTLQPPPKAAPTESSEATSGGKDVKKDGDADDAGTQGANTANPVINSLGQQIGSHLNVKA